jgi:hypothetical protein
VPDDKFNTDAPRREKTEEEKKETTVTAVAADSNDESAPDYIDIARGPNMLKPIRVSYLSLRLDPETDN